MKLYVSKSGFQLSKEAKRKLLRLEKIHKKKRYSYFKKNIDKIMKNVHKDNRVRIMELDISEGWEDE
jgi:hypothetical protein